MKESNAVLEEIREAAERGKGYLSPQQRVMIAFYLVGKCGQYALLVGAGR